MTTGRGKVYDNFLLCRTFHLFSFFTTVAGKRTRPAFTARVPRRHGRGH
jgi:hypothetical protein